MKTILRSILFLSVGSLFMLNACRTQTEYTYLEGMTQGGFYHITYFDKKQRNFAHAVDSILQDIDLSLSTYNSNSIISRINRNDTTVKPNEHFIRVFNASMKLSELTSGNFDITVAPIVGAWGFDTSNYYAAVKDTFIHKGKNYRKPLVFKGGKVDSLAIKKLLALVGYHKIAIEKGKVIKADKAMKLDVNAIAQGYTVDVLTAFFEKYGIKNYLVEVGGELSAHGENPNGETWHVGIDKPVEHSAMPGEDLQVVVCLQNRSLATSGNYRKYYEEGGIKYSHTINPFTGFPARNNLLSATVVADDCSTADAIATACMVMGVEQSRDFFSKHPQFDAYLVYSNKKGKYEVYATPKFQKMIKPQD